MNQFTMTVVVEMPLNYDPTYDALDGYARALAAAPSSRFAVVEPGLTPHAQALGAVTTEA